MSRGPTQRDLAAADHLNSAAIHLLRGMRPVDQRAGLTAARLSALSVLVYGGPQTLSDLARIEDVRPPTMAGIVDGLAAAGLARRGPHPSSQRSVLVRATAAGERLMHQARQARLETIALALGSLDPAAKAAIRAAAPHLRRLAAVVPDLIEPDADRP
ncbi:MarR family winged helix-turn-helix transcriptional regulator [Nocardioides sp.]|uniref:MarR family winged helix-turn-helix transcriptional regulator n=1 Tax=Nocardioides sp. TaxID=35761 RepID=UPI002ED0B2EA